MTEGYTEEKAVWRATFLSSRKEGKEMASAEDPEPRGMDKVKVLLVVAATAALEYFVMLKEL